MVKEIVDRVTVTGADDSIHPKKLVEIYEKYRGLVEFGILFSPDCEGIPRFPSAVWLAELTDINKSLPEKLPLSAHLCGNWVKAICEDGNMFFMKHHNILWMFQRFQLNFHGQLHKVHPHQFLAHVANLSRHGRQLIFQMDGVNDKLLRMVKERRPEANVAAIFDRSSGGGILPEEWPRVIKDCYCIYSGGLSPDNLDGQMEKIVKVASPGPIGLDLERNLRSSDDKQFVLGKTYDSLEATKPWVKKN